MSAAFSARAFMKTPDEASHSLSRSQQAAQQIARRLISTRRPEPPGGDSPARNAAAACDYLYRTLSRWVGPDGCHALYARALAQAANEYPALERIQLRPRSKPYIDGVPQTITEHGDGATAKAFESMLVRLVELLGRLIGDDMAMKLIEQSWAAPERGDANSDDRREEA
jgi:hypothetical protein